MWVDNAIRKPAKDGNYPVRRKSQAEGQAFHADICYWLPNKFTRRTHGAWYNIRRGGRVYDVLEWWEDDHND